MKFSITKDGVRIGELYADEAKKHTVWTFKWTVPDKCGEGIRQSIQQAMMNGKKIGGEIDGFGWTPKSEDETRQLPRMTPYSH